jgi:hypothetical protein
MSHCFLVVGKTGEMTEGTETFLLIRGPCVPYSRFLPLDYLVFLFMTEEKNATSIS